MHETGNENGIKWNKRKILLHISSNCYLFLLRLLFFVDSIFATACYARFLHLDSIFNLFFYLLHVDRPFLNKFCSLISWVHLTFCAFCDSFRSFYCWLFVAISRKHIFYNLSSVNGEYVFNNNHFSFVLLLFFLLLFITRWFVVLVVVMLLLLLCIFCPCYTMFLFIR